MGLERGNCLDRRSPRLHLRRLPGGRRRLRELRGVPARARPPPRCADVNVGSLFSGIGGLDLGLERAGMRIVWQCESDPWRREVLHRHWPGMLVYHDVRHIGETAGAVDLICGGFPCQPVSVAGKRKGTEDERWLWPEFARVVRLLRPHYVLVENVPGILFRGGGMGDVLGDLAACGYDAEWQSIPASSVGSPQRRERIFIVAYPEQIGLQEGFRVFDPDACRSIHKEIRKLAGIPNLERSNSGRVWPVPDGGLHGVANGVPSRLDGLAALGDAVVPQVAELVGRRIMEHAPRD